MFPQGAQGKTAGVCLTLTFEASGDVLWAGDSKVRGWVDLHTPRHTSGGTVIDVSL